MLRFNKKTIRYDLIKKCKVKAPQLFLYLTLATIIGFFAAQHDNFLVEKQKRTFEFNKTALSDNRYQLQSNKNMLHLFSSDDIALQKKQLASSDIQPTKLNISLVGVIQSNDPEKTIALLSYKGNTLSYTTSDIIINDENITLHKIEASSVIIINNSKPEIIKLFSDNQYTNQGKPQQHVRELNNHTTRDRNPRGFLQGFKSIHPYQ